MAQVATMKDIIAEHTIDAIHLDRTVAQAINQLMLATWPQIAQNRVGMIEFLLQRWKHYSGAVTGTQYHLVYLSGELVALAHKFSRAIASQEGEMILMGLANVCVANRVRGSGYGRLVAQAAFARVKQGDFSLALFQTTPQVETFYQQLGCRT